MKTSISHNTWLVIVPVLGLAIAYVFFLYLPGQEAIGKLREDLATREEFIQQVEAFGAAIEATRQEFDKTEEYVQRWEESAPSEDELSVLFGRISQLAKDSGTTTTRFEPQPATHYDAIGRIPLAVECLGSFGQICEFLRSLEGLEETIWVENLQMERVGEGGGDVKCELSLAVFADNPDDSDQVDLSE